MKILYIFLAFFSYVRYIKTKGNKRERVFTCVWWSGAGWPVLSNSVGEAGRASIATNIT